MSQNAGNIDAYLEKLVSQQSHVVQAMFEKRLIQFVKYEDGTYAFGFDTSVNRAECRKIHKALSAWIKANPHVDLAIPEVELH